MWQDYFARTLEESFREAKSRNKSISLRAYAMRIDTAPGMFSEITRGRRHVSWERALKIAAKAEFPAAAIKRLESLQKSESKKTPRMILKDNALDLIFNPLYYRVLCAFEIMERPLTLAELAEFLEVKPLELSPILEGLGQLQIVKSTGEKYSWSGQHLSTPPNVTSEKVQNFFRQHLTRAAEGLSVPPAEREYTSITFAGNMAEIEEVKKSIRRFREQVSDSMNVEPNQIFEFSMQLRPVSQVSEKGAK